MGIIATVVIALGIVGVVVGFFLFLTRNRTREVSIRYVEVTYIDADGDSATDEGWAETARGYQQMFIVCWYQGDTTEYGTNRIVNVDEGEWLTIEVGDDPPY